MADSFCVEDYEPFQHLCRNFFRVRRWYPFALHILAEIPVLDILHRKKHMIRVFIPSEKLDKQVSVLHGSISLAHRLS